MSLARVLDEAHARQLPALIVEWLAAPDARRWIAVALRIDLALLTERPELVVPCLYRRCAWLDNDSCYHRRAAIPDDAAELRALVESWVAEWQPGQTWLRSLRAPSTPLDGGVVEEYRTSLRGGEDGYRSLGGLWISADRSVIGVSGPTGTVAWERVTGRQLPDAANRPASPPTPHWTVRLPTTNGTVTLDSVDGRHSTVPLDPHEGACGLFELDDNTFVIATTNDTVDPYDFDATPSYAHYLVRDGHVVWRADGQCDRVTRDGAALVIAGSDRVVVRSIEDGRAVLERGLPYGAHLPIDRHTVATRTSFGIVVSEMSNLRQIPDVLHTGGWTMLSPDGARALCHTALCDVQSGAIISDIALAIGNWLEGGPAFNCRMLCNDVLVEVMPFGTKIWETRTGTLIVDDRAREASVGDALAIDPTGRFLAHSRRDSGVLDLVTLREGAHVGQWPARFDSFRPPIGFSSDGEWLWWTSGETSWIVATARPGAPRAITEPPQAFAPREARVADGLLALGGALIPADDARVLVTPDERFAVGGIDHYALCRP